MIIRQDCVQGSPWSRSRTVRAVVFGLACLAGLSAGAGEARADPIYFAGTGSFYERVNLQADWIAARDLAEGLTYLGIQGRLATITSQEENDFLRDTFGAPESWIGGFQVDGATEPAGGYRWITDETFDFTNWAPNEPNNSSGDPSNPNERFIALKDDGFWNDLAGPPRTTAGFYVEYDGVPIPEPSSIVLLGIGTVGAVGLAWRTRRRRDTA